MAASAAFGGLGFFAQEINSPAVMKTTNKSVLAVGKEADGIEFPSGCGLAESAGRSTQHSSKTPPWLAELQAWRLQAQFG
jgi:hypothetical protein